MTPHVSGLLTGEPEEYHRGLDRPVADHGLELLNLRHCEETSPRDEPFPLDGRGAREPGVPVGRLFRGARPVPDACAGIPSASASGPVGRPTPPGDVVSTSWTVRRVLDR